MKVENIKDIISFSAYLKKLHIHNRIDQYRSESLTMTITLVGNRIEVDFFEDHIEYSIFSGDESVLDNSDQLLKIIDNYHD